MSINWSIRSQRMRIVESLKDQWKDREFVAWIRRENIDWIGTRKRFRLNMIET